MNKGKLTLDSKDSELHYSSTSRQCVPAEQARPEMEENVRNLLLSILENGSHVIKDEEEYKILRDYADTGLVAFGFHFIKRQSEAKLTSLGKRYVEFIVKPGTNQKS